MNVAEELETQGYIRLSALVNELAQGLGIPHAGGLIKEKIQAPLARFRQLFIDQGLVVQYGNSPTCAYNLVLVYFCAAWYRKFPPFSGKRVDQFTAAKFRSDFFSGEDEALKHIPERMREGYERLVQAFRFIRGKHFICNFPHVAAHTLFVTAFIKKSLHEW